MPADSMRPIEYKWDERHGKILVSFIEKLQHSAVRYIILRNYEGLPAHNASKDCDVIIEPGSYAKASQALREAYAENGISNYHIRRYARVRCWYGINLKDDLYIHIDLIEGYLSRGVEVFAFNELHAAAIRYNGFTVLNDTYDAVLLLFYKLVGSRRLIPRYRQKIAAVYQSHSGDMDRILHEKLGREASGRVIAALRAGDYEALEKLSQTISRSSKVRATLRAPLRTLCNHTAYLCEQWYKIILCPGKYRKIIAVEAPDGTGKTTFIDNITNLLANAFVSEPSRIHVYHHRPTLLPNLGAAGEKLGVMKEDRNFTVPHRGKPANRISSLLRMTYYWSDYVLGGALCIRRDAQFDKFSIFDRYIYDFLIDPQRSRINLPYWLRRLFTRLVPQPRIVFVLEADAETIYARKPELTLQEIRRQLKEFQRLSQNNRRCIVIDAMQSPDEMASQAMEHIVRCLTKNMK